MIGGLVDRLLRRMTRSGLRRGIGGEGWVWLALAGAALVVRRARRTDRPTATIDLRPGDRYVVSLLPPGADGRGDRAAPNA